MKLFQPFNGITTALLGVSVILLASSAPLQAAQPLCYQSAQSLAHTLAATAFGRDTARTQVHFDGEDEFAHYTIEVQSNPVQVRDGKLHTYALRYIVSFDNDSELACSLIEVTKDFSGAAQ